MFAPLLPHLLHSRRIDWIFLTRLRCELVKQLHLQQSGGNWDPAADTFLCLVTIDPTAMFDTVNPGV